MRRGEERGRARIGAAGAAHVGTRRRCWASRSVDPAAHAQESLIDSDPAVVRARAEVEAAQQAAHEAEAKLEATTQHQAEVEAEHRRPPAAHRRARPAARRARPGTRHVARPPAPARGRAVLHGRRRHQRGRHLLRQRARRRASQAAGRCRVAERSRQRHAARGDPQDPGRHPDVAAQGAGATSRTSSRSSRGWSPRCSRSRPRSTSVSPKPTPRSSGRGPSVRCTRRVSR